MREKIYLILNKLYGITMLISFFAGLLPAVALIAAIVIGGPAGEAICLFVYKQYYPWVIALAAGSVLLGLAAMYVGKKNSGKK
jgi:hypothetical protein